MAVLKRYRCLGIDGMEESKRGEWVRHEDYLLLVQQLEEIRRNLLQLRDPRYRDIQRKARDEN
jgi:hypothetical protein